MVDTSVLIDAYVRCGRIHGRQKLVEIFEQAFCDVNAGVQVTSVTFEGASGSGQQIEIDPSKLLAIVEQALQVIDDQVDGRANHLVYGGGIIEV